MGIVVLIAIVSLFFKSGKTNDAVQIPTGNSIATLSVIEIISPGVFEIDAENGNQKRELKTGDKLNNQIGVKTNKTGKANINLPDGSIVRLEPNTTMILDEAFYNEQSERIIVKLKLVTGRLWSKIISLGTPDSEWTVKTANAIAVVRGTSFGAAHEEGNSLFIGSENVVSVKAIDPETSKEIDGTETSISANVLVEIKKDEIKNIAEKKQPLALLKIEDRKDVSRWTNWIEAQQKEDDEINIIIENIKNEGGGRKELREEIKQIFIDDTIFKNIQEKTLKDEPADEIQLENGPSNKNEILQEATPNLRIKSDELIKIEGIEEPKPIERELSSPRKTKKAIGLEIATAHGLDNIIEGETIQFMALLRYDDNSIKDVTHEVAWQVLGPIGKINSEGLFTPRLTAEVAEFGKAVGNVIGVYKNLNEGVNLIDSTPIFEVNLKIEPIIDTRG